MKLIINASLNYVGGGLQVALSFIQECTLISDNMYYVFISNNVAAQIEQTKYPNNFVFYKIPNLKFYQYDKYLSHLEKEINPDVVFSIFGPVYWKPLSPHVMGYAIPHYIYNESPYWNLISIKNKFLLKLRKLIHFYYLERDASTFICETDDVRKRISLLFPKKQFFTVSNTCNSIFLDQSLKELYVKLGDNNKFRFLTLSKYYPHKNLSVIRFIVDELRKRIDIVNIQFVLTITASEYFTIFGDQYKDEILTVGPIPIKEAPSLYNECDAMFLPTLLECFSASYPEAMIMGKPILTSNLGFAKTVCQDAAIYFNPMDVQDMTDKILDLVNNPNLRKDLVDKGVKRIAEMPSAKERALIYLDICKKII